MTGGQRDPAERLAIRARAQSADVPAGTDGRMDHCVLAPTGGQRVRPTDHLLSTNSDTQTHCLDDEMQR